MSVLSFPRIYFKGFIGWDPCTFNNNDWQEFPTYDGVNVALNWQFLATQGITPDNYPRTFRPWAIKLQKDAVDNPPGARVPAEWNMFGTHGVEFVQYNEFKSVITGGALAWNQPVTSDPLIGALVGISGDQGNGPGRLVDTNPFSFWSSQVYFGQMSFTAGNSIISGPRNFRMHSRWLDLNRIYTTDQALTQPAASVGCCFQTCIPFDQVNWVNIGSSPLAMALQQAASQSPATGIMIRFTAYVNLYFKNGVFNNIPQRPRNYEDLAKLLADGWAAWDVNPKDTSGFFSNPCYSHMVGTLGVWNADEVASVPVGRYLSASGQVAAISNGSATPSPARAMGHQISLARAAAPAAASAPPPLVTLGPIVANVDYNNQLISLDLNSTIPENGTPGEFPSDLTKTDFGPLDFGIINDDGFTSIYQIPYDQYAKDAYEASAGIIDIPFGETITGPNTGPLLQNGGLAIQVQGQTALQELPLSAQTDERGIYIDEGTSAEFVVAAYNLGATATNTPLIVAQYDANLNLIPTGGSPLVAFTNGDIQQMTSGGTTTTVTVVTTDETGVATVSIEWVAAGFAVLAFFPYAGPVVPGQLPISLLGPCATTSGSITYAFYTTVRALPGDNNVPQQFVDLWNSSNGDQTKAWNFIYGQILYVYDMLFNVMLEYVNLGDPGAFAGAISGIWSAISAESALESSYAMPITRDLSAGKRLALQLWIYLIAMNYPVPINVNSIPPGWAPPSNPPSGAAH
jgi:hypothetical protein